MPTSNFHEKLESGELTKEDRSEPNRSQWFEYPPTAKFNEYYTRLDADAEYMEATRISANRLSEKLESGEMTKSTQLRKHLSVE